MSTAIFLLTLTLAIWRPKGLGIGFIALGGAFLALASGAIAPANLPGVRIILGNATFTLVAFIGLSWVLEQTGVFRWLALQVARWPLAKGRSLLILVALTTAVASAFLTNCGALLMVIPIALEVLILLRFNPKATFAFITTCGFMADWASLPFTTSNLVNTLASSYSNISFGRYASVMVPVSIAAIATSIAVLLFYFQRHIPATYHRFDWSTQFQALPPGTSKKPQIPANSLEVENTSKASSDRTFFSLIDSSNFSFDPLSGGVYVNETPDSLLPFTSVTSRSSSPFYQSTWFKILNTSSVQAILFTCGMYVVAIALNNDGFTASLSFIFAQLAEWGLPLAAIGTSFSAGVQAAVMNNLPAILIETSAIQSAIILDPGLREGMIYAAIIGSVLGAKISPIGSLSTLLWIGILQRRGFHLSWSSYCRLSAVLTLPVFFVALLVLVIWLSVLI